MKLHLFRNFKFVRTIEQTEQPANLLAITQFQFREGTQEIETFTVLDPVSGIALSQDYRKMQPGFCWHSAMWKHVRGVRGPVGPSFDDLEKLIPAEPAQSMSDFFSREDVRLLQAIQQTHRATDPEHIRATAQIKQLAQAVGAGEYFPD